MLQYSPPATYQRSVGHSAATCSLETREFLITSHLAKVKYIADRIAAKLPSTVERDDLYGAGVVGLIDAVERFDPTRGIAFTTFAELRVRGAIMDDLRSLDWASRATRGRASGVQNAFLTLEKEAGRAVTEAEVAAHLQIPVSDVRETLQDIRRLKLANLEDRDEHTGMSISDFISDSSISPLDEAENTEFRNMLAEAVDKLPERERKVIALYYLEELTMKEIGEVMGVTESRVSQLRTQAVARLRSKLNK
jgi:RNA polymerase sigma factor for flagellar operon FliA